MRWPELSRNGVNHLLAAVVEHRQLCAARGMMLPPEMAALEAALVSLKVSTGQHGSPLVEPLQDAEADGMTTTPRLAYNAPEVSQTLGWSLSTTKRRIADGTLPSIKVGRTRRVPADALNAFLDTRAGR